MLHPYIINSANKETHYFDKLLKSGPFWYRNQFNPSIDLEIGLDKTDNYFSYRSNIPDTIKKISPESKIILAVCDPVLRLKIAYDNLFKLGDKILQSDRNKMLASLRVRLIKSKEKLPVEIQRENSDIVYKSLLF